MSDERLTAIGWTKCGAMAPFVTDDTVHELLALAETSTVYEIEPQTRDMQAIPDARCFLLCVHPEDYAAFEALMLTHGAVLSGGRLTLKDAAFSRLLQELAPE